MGETSPTDAVGVPVTQAGHEHRRPAARASMREVADRAGVAMSSVSRVLSGHPDVSGPMREKVMAVVAELGYQPDLLAQSLRRRETRSVGFVVGDIANPLLAEIVKGAESALRERGYSMLLTNSENQPERDAAHVRLFEQRRVDGLMLSLASEDNPETVQVLRQFETPAVLVDRELSADVGASAVLSDHRGGMRDAVSHLLDLGHRRIGLIVGQPMRPSRERRAGLEDAFSARGLPATYTVLEGMLSAEHGRNATRRLLAAPEPPTAIVAGGNQLLVGALGELLSNGLRIGPDVSLVSCDAIDVTELFDPPIAVVLRDNREIGSQAATLLLERLGEEDPGPRTVMLPTAFHPRASCAPPPGG
jgi:LacI family transcriptional regulator